MNNFRVGAVVMRPINDGHHHASMNRSTILCGAMMSMMMVIGD
jgi:hypothetical protein